MVQNGYKVASGNSTKDLPNWEIYSNKKLLFARKESLYDKIMLISELLHCLEDLLRWNQKLRYKRFVYITFWKKWMCALKLLQVGGFSFSQIRWLKTHCCQSDTLMFNCKLSLNFFSLNNWFESMKNLIGSLRPSTKFSFQSESIDQTMWCEVITASIQYIKRTYLFTWIWICRGVFLKKNQMSK